MSRNDNKQPKAEGRRKAYLDAFPLQMDTLKAHRTSELCWTNPKNAKPLYGEDIEIEDPSGTAAFSVSVQSNHFNILSDTIGSNPLRHIIVHRNQRKSAKP